MTAINLDEELVLEENNWRGRIITLLVLLGVTIGVAVAVWYFFMREDSVELSRSTEEIPVARGTINQTLSVTGVADAQLNSNLVFQTSGKVATVDVRVGDLVRQGQVLASLESEDLANSVGSAQAGQRAAQLKLDDLLAGSTAAELAAADQALAQAQAAYTKSQNDYADLQEGPDAADVAVAQQGVTAAQAQVATAQSAREKLADTPSAADLAAAEAGVASAESSLTAAENSARSAENTVQSAEASLKSAETSYCSVDGAPSFCVTQATPISSSDANAMDAALDGPNATQALAVITANNTYLNAENSAESAEAAVTAAEDGVASAEAKLDVANDGPPAEEVAAADTAIASAYAAVVAAQEKLAKAEEGATALELSTASAAVDSAGASLTAAQAKRVEAYRGPKANAIEQARQAVRTAQLQVQASEINLKNAQIIAPFDGVVASVNASPGEFMGSVSETPPIVLLTPDAVTLKISVSETDYQALKKDLGGIAFFDGLPGKPYPFRVTEIGLAPTVNQGVVTYDVVGSIVILPDNPRPPPGMNARGQITTESKPNVLIVPPRALRRKGAEQVVDVKRDGRIEEVVVTTGVTDNEQVEILTGLNEGDVVTVVTLTSGPAGAAGAPAPTPQGVPTLPGGVR